ncbi:MAG: DUF2817 domain-containing protein [Chloroflexi bacterium]|nr:DUF2817 domain-containing protein [Chloroflexota bacterium]
MFQPSDWFPDSYSASRERFHAYLELMQAHWTQVQIHREVIDTDEDLSIDWIQAHATDHPKKLFILTTGEHGIEAYVGAAMLKLFVEQYLEKLEPQDTGLLLVHAINPWGMAHRRRVNLNNVDLNRNFLWDAADFEVDNNPDYAHLDAFLNPRKPAASNYGASFTFVSNFVRQLFQVGRTELTAATLLGQYIFPQGVYYGGGELQPETSVMMDLYRQTVAEYEQVLHIDVHTGYGPRYQMSLVNSPLETRTPPELKKLFNYPQIVAADPEAFYSIQGDMVDWLYRLFAEKYAGKRFFSTAFEFGTYGDSLLAAIRSLRTMIAENQLHWNGARNPKNETRICAAFRELFWPAEERWQQKAIADGQMAFEGILRGEGYID